MLKVPSSKGRLICGACGLESLDANSAAVIANSHIAIAYTSLSPFGNVAIVVVGNGWRQAKEPVGEQAGLAGQLAMRAEIVERVVIVDGIRRQHTEGFRHVVDAEGGQEALLPIKGFVDVDDSEVFPGV